MNRKTSEAVEAGGLLLLNVMVESTFDTVTKAKENPMQIIGLANNMKIFVFEGEVSWETAAQLRQGDVISGVVRDISTSIYTRELSSGVESSEKQTGIYRFEITEVKEGTFGEKIEGVSDNFYARAPRKSNAGAKKKNEFAEQTSSVVSDKVPKGADLL